MRKITKSERLEYLRAVREYRKHRALMQAYYNVFDVSTKLDKENQFKKLKIDKLTETGTTRVRRTGFDEQGRPIYKIIRYKGINALKVQLKSLQRLGSAEYLKEKFIKNYRQAMRKLDYSLKDINEVTDRIKKIDTWKLGVIIKSGEFPIPDFIYAGESKTKDEILNMIEVSENAYKLTETKKRQVEKEYNELLTKYKKTIKGY